VDLLAGLGVNNLNYREQVQRYCVFCSLDRAKCHPGLSGWFDVVCFKGGVNCRQHAYRDIGSRIMRGAIVEGCLLQLLFCFPDAASLYPGYDVWLVFVS